MESQTAHEDDPAARPGDASRPGRPVLLVTSSLLLGVLAGLGIAILVWGGHGPGGPDAPDAGAREVTVAGAAASGVVAEAAAAALPSVVRVDVSGPSIGGPANGSGVVMAADGLVVTNLHVVAGATTVLVELADGDRVRAEVIGTDPDHDLALLQVARTGLQPIAVAGAPPAVGSLAVAIGAPFGLSASVSAGVVSAIDRTIEVPGVDGEPMRLPSLVQTDAAINPGSSGGPLVDARGALIGVTSAILSGARAEGAGVGFAIPADVVVEQVAQMSVDGTPDRPRLGLRVRRADRDLAGARGAGGGVLVEGVATGSPADEAGILVDDLLTRAGEAVLLDVADLLVAVRAAGVGGTIHLTRVASDGDPHVVEVLLDAVE